LLRQWRTSSLKKNEGQSQSPEDLKWLEPQHGEANF